MPPANPLAMPPGVLYPLTIQAKTGPQDSNGEPTWVSILDTRGVFATLGSREVNLQRQITGTTSHMITMAYVPGVTIGTDMRVLFGGRYLTILSPPENVGERNRILKLNCQEIGDSGPVA